MLNVSQAKMHTKNAIKNHILFSHLSCSALYPSLAAASSDENNEELILFCLIANLNNIGGIIVEFISAQLKAPFHRMYGKFMIRCVRISPKFNTVTVKTLAPCCSSFLDPIIADLSCIGIEKSVLFMIIFFPHSRCFSVAICLQKI